MNSVPVGRSDVVNFATVKTFVFFTWCHQNIKFACRNIWNSEVLVTLFQSYNWQIQSPACNKSPKAQFWDRQSARRPKNRRQCLHSWTVISAIQRPMWSGEHNAMITMTIATLHCPIAFESMPGVQRAILFTNISLGIPLYVMCKVWELVEICLWCSLMPIMLKGVFRSLEHFLV